MRYNMKKGLLKTGIVISIVLCFSCTKIDYLVPTQACEKGIPNHPNASRYQKLADALLSQGVVGASLTILSPEGIWSAGIGMADLQNKVSMTPCHTLRIGSVSKIFCATAILKLHDEGKLNINDKASKYLPQEFTKGIANADQATIKQLLNHTSGIVEYSTISNILQILNLSIVKHSAEENLRSIFGKKANFNVGKKDEYSNSNFLLLSLIIKAVGKMEAYEYITKNLLLPNGITDVYASTIIPTSLSRAYYDNYDNGIMMDRTEIENNAVGGSDMLDGGMIANSYDLALFHEKLMTGKILSENFMAELYSFNPVTQDLGDELSHLKGYSLGLMKLETNYGIAIGHYGTVQSFNGMVYYFPQQQVTMALIRNADSAKIKKFAESKEIFDFLFEE
ncbi:D-alanyl-D-alanine carboxypeptidase [Dyadobacter jejuensis]|uniref:D-alanyl-D-alanine carboxypeptidase n=1 Tax=Dyadobacter jejuensis TaxID=1082580 RepID=A0A316AE36_9BACT|nr:serine hydrolase domain-containing protein [Dyadobacter jejuensis]PWJ55538.1 D-alanyl-D-alanine carboxypeptidase [Dyadobacter jejuensis]